MHPCSNPHHAHCGRGSFPCDELLTASGDRICLSNHHTHPERLGPLDTHGAAAIAEALFRPTGGRLRAYT